MMENRTIGAMIKRMGFRKIVPKGAMMFSAMSAWDCRRSPAAMAGSIAIRICPARENFFLFLLGFFCPSPSLSGTSCASSIASAAVGTWMPFSSGLAAPLFPGMAVR